MSSSVYLVVTPLTDLTEVIFPDNIRVITSNNSVGVTSFRMPLSQPTYKRILIQNLSGTPDITLTAIFGSTNFPINTDQMLEVYYYGAAQGSSVPQFKVYYDSGIVPRPGVFGDFTLFVSSTGPNFVSITNTPSNNMIVSVGVQTPSAFDLDIPFAANNLAVGQRYLLVVNVNLPPGGADPNQIYFLRARAVAGVTASATPFDPLASPFFSSDLTIPPPANPNVNTNTNAVVFFDFLITSEVPELEIEIANLTSESVTAVPFIANSIGIVTLIPLAV